MPDVHQFILNQVANVDDNIGYWKGHASFDRELKDRPGDAELRYRFLGTYCSPQKEGKFEHQFKIWGNTVYLSVPDSEMSTLSGMKAKTDASEFTKLPFILAGTEKGTGRLAIIPFDRSRCSYAVAQAAEARGAVIPGPAGVAYYTLNISEARFDRDTGKLTGIKISKGTELTADSLQYARIRVFVNDTMQRFSPQWKSKIQNNVDLFTMTDTGSRTGTLEPLFASAVLVLETNPEVKAYLEAKHRTLAKFLYEKAQQ